MPQYPSKRERPVAFATGLSNQTRSRSSLLGVQLDATILGTTLFGVVRRNRTRLTVRFDRQPVRIDTVAGQVTLDRLRAALRQTQVVGLSATRVGVSFDHDGNIGLILE